MDGEHAAAIRCEARILGVHLSAFAAIKDLGMPRLQDVIHSRHMCTAGKKKRQGLDFRRAIKDLGMPRLQNIIHSRHVCTAGKKKDGG